MKKLLIPILLAAALAILPATAHAQTALNSTTTNGAVTATQQIVTLTAVTNIALNDLVFFADGREAAQVNAIDTAAKQVTLARGVLGTLSHPHGTGVLVWTGPRVRFYFNEPVGACTSTSEAFLPHIVLPGANAILGGDVYDCINSQWTRLRDNGMAATAGLIDTSSTASGAVQSTEYVLNSVTIPATDWASMRGVRCVAVGTGAANANAKNLKFYFGATAVATVTGTTDSGKDYLGEIVVWRSGASTQAGYGAISSDVGAPDALAVTTALAESESAAIVISFKSANTAAAAASATGKGLYCHVLP